MRGSWRRGKAAFPGETTLKGGRHGRPNHLDKSKNASHAYAWRRCRVSSRLAKLSPRPSGRPASAYRSPRYFNGPRVLIEYFGGFSVGSATSFVKLHQAAGGTIPVEAGQDMTLGSKLLPAESWILHHRKKEVLQIDRLTAPLTTPSNPST